MQGFSRMPFGLPAHYWTQRHVTRSLPSSEGKFFEIFANAKRHISAYEQLRGTDVSTAAFYEFGAGWELSIPFCFYALGVEQQTLVDIRPLSKLELVNNTIRKVKRLGSSLGIRRVPERCLPSGRSSNWTALLEEWYGIRYLAPCDARSTKLPASSVDFVTSTATLEHIPAPDIELVLLECHRLLKEDGGASFIIDYQDHYSYFDRNISYYNFLRYSPRLWRIYNSPLHFQNRLRHRDYRELLARSGFEVDSEQPIEPTGEDMEILGRLSTHPTFSSHYTVKELAIRGAHFVLRKRDTKNAAACESKLGTKSDSVPIHPAI